jgi:PIN domain nuclease of toxin-antitoxin system
VRITDPAGLPPRAPLVIDTHVWVWFAVGDASKLHQNIPDVLERAAREQRLFASVASVWEIALKAERGELRVGADLHAWVAEQQSAPGVRLLSIVAPVAIDSTTLPPWIRRADGRPHRDPNDRFIVATARRRNAVLVTCDGPVLDYSDEGHVTALDARP